MSGNATPHNSADSGTPASKRWRAADRREALVAATLDLLVTDGIDAVSMDAVAERANVSRPLVYKHFANRTELLAEVLRREAAALDVSISKAVAEADGFEDSIRALVRAVLDAVDTHTSIVSALLRAAGRNSELRQQQRRRDGRTVRYFAGLATNEFNLDEERATAATSMLLMGIEAVRAQARDGLTPQRRTLLEDVYVTVVVGGIAALAST